MTKVEAMAEFKEYILPFVIIAYSKDDVTAICEAWNDWTDGLCKNGDITENQYNNRNNPY